MADDGMSAMIEAQRKKEARSLRVILAVSLIRSKAATAAAAAYTTPPP